MPSQLLVLQNWGMSLVTESKESAHFLVGIYALVGFDGIMKIWNIEIVSCARLLSSSERCVLSDMCRSVSLIRSPFSSWVAF